MINALFVLKDGCYFNIPGVLPWDQEKNAFKCENGFPAIAHPPCERWGRYWFGGPSASERKQRGDDKGCFAFALWYVRTWGGVLEHPADSSAWAFFGLSKPSSSGGWFMADNFGGFTCHVEQGHYGHRARKATWLYACKTNLPDLKWGPSESSARIDAGFHSREERATAKANGWREDVLERLSKRERAATPIEFREILIKIANSAQSREVVA